MLEFWFQFLRQIIIILECDNSDNISIYVFVKVQRNYRYLNVRDAPLNNC